jgi:hypothetical protein
MNILTGWKQTPKAEYVDRRTQPRLPSKDGAFAFLSLANMIGGQIHDINDDGLSFRYVASEQKVAGHSLLDIMIRGSNYHYHRLPCETVWDYAEPEEFSLGPFTTRCCGVRFGDLTETQKQDLKSFIEQVQVV